MVIPNAAPAEWGIYALSPGGGPVFKGCRFFVAAFLK